MALSRRFVELDGRRVSYLTAGESDAPTILLVHGSGMSAGSWVNQLRGLREFGVAAIDLPGHGESDSIPQASVEAYAETVAKFLGALRAGPVLVVGHSLGGAVAIALAALRPDAVAGLVLVASCTKLPWVDSARERWLPYLPGPLWKIFFLSAAQKVLFAPGAPGHAIGLGMRELRSCRAATILEDLQAAKVMDVTEQATGLDVPTLILCGSHDRLTPPELSAHLEGLVRRSRLCIIEGAGHMLPLEEPTRVTQEIVSFARSLTGAVPSSRSVGSRRGRSLAGQLLDLARAYVPFLTSQ